MNFKNKSVFSMWVRDLYHFYDNNMAQENMRKM